MLERIHLEIIRGIEQQGSLTKAARSLNLTQSALSHSIIKLEKRLELNLWRKSGRRIVLTDAGLMLLSLAKKVLPQLERAEENLLQTGRGEQGTLRIGMECHPCYQWLLAIVGPFLQRWPKVDIDVKQKFQFGGIGALYAHDIDILITPDPLYRQGLLYHAVGDYELVAVMSQEHIFCDRSYLLPSDLDTETLITYPVPVERLDIFNQFLLPAKCMPRNHKTLETTEMILHMIAVNRGIGVLPDWIVKQYAASFSIKAIRLGKKGLLKTTYLGMRHEDQDLGYIKGFLEIAGQSG